MTGGGGAGGSGRPPRDAWRGVRETSRAPAPKRGEQGGQAWGGAVEVEELPAQSVLRRGTPRLGLGGTLAVGAIVVLLAAGFGVLGGRPETSPAPSRAALVDPTGDPGPPAGPRVTPWIECAEPQATAPNVFLQVDGVPMAGVMEVQDGLDGSLPPPAVSFPGVPIEVPVDVRSELWIEDGVCAVAWTIGLLDDQHLEVVPNSTHDPAHASQNRFELVLGPHPGGDRVLRAALVFPTLVVHATWPIRIVPVEQPVARVHRNGDDVEPVMGCDVTLTLATGWTNDLNPCADDVGEPPLDAALVRRGERLVFEIVGWQMDSGGVTCGRLFGPSFMPRPQRDCDLVMSSEEPLIFEAPTKRGRWTLALSACGTSEASAVAAFNVICGTWYANIVVGE